MNKTRQFATSILVGFFYAACGAGHSTTTSQQGGAGGSSVTMVGGAGGNSGGGTGGNLSGGTTGASSGGAAGDSSGGAGGISSGGAAGSVSGGVTGTGGRAGSTGGAPGTGGGNQAGGVTGQGGGSTSASGTNNTGGKTGATGGAPGSGGAQGTGGTTTAGTGGSTTTSEPKLIISGQDAYWQTATLTEVTSGTVDVTINDTTASQRWDGFGGTFNEVGWNVLSMLPASESARAIKLLFDAQDGARFVFGRVPIGASDYAMDRYTLDETANDTTMANFSLDRDRQKLIPYIKAALAINSKLRLWASPWTPPTWMKTGPFTSSTSTNFDGGNMKDDGTVLTAHALYLSRFVEDYGKEGITIEAIHPQNEPGYNTNYPSCLWTAALFNKFIRDYLGPTFASRSVKAQIYLGTMSNNDSGKDGTIITTVTGDTASMNFVKGFGLQWNMLPVVSGLKSKNLPIVQTEHKCGNYPWNPGGGLPQFNPNKAQNDYPYAVESWGYIRDWIKAGVTTYSAWNMVLDSAGKNLDAVRPWPQNALLTVDTSAKTLTVTPVYYVFRHFSQYVDPGATVVGTTGGDAIAFKNPNGTLVAVVHNTAASAKAMIVAAGGKKYQFSVPANGFATVNPQ